MKLVKFSLHLTNEIGYIDEWSMDNICLNDLNLIVGKNSTGKTRALKVLKVFVKSIIEGKFVLGHFVFCFKTDENEAIVYEIKHSKGSIYEKITINGSNILLNRNEETAEIYSYSEEKSQIIHPPANKLTLHVRRDVNEYPFFEKIVKWAEMVHFFNFGHLHASSSFDNLSEEKEKTFSSNLSIGEMVSELSLKGKSDVITTFNEFGYNLTDIAPDLQKDKKEIVVNENYLTQSISESSISQGMFRALSLLVFIQFMLEKKSLKTIIIDDLCEGLDYERSSKLGKKIFDILKENDVQTIA